MESRNRTDLVRKYFAAYESKDRIAVESVLSDDFRFTSPLDERIDRFAYFERCWPYSARVRRFEIENLAENGDDVFVRYRCEPTTGARFRNVELFRFDAGKITQIEVFFGSLPENAKAPNPTLERTGDGSRKYLCLVYHENARLEALSQSDLDALVAACIDWVADLERTGRHIFSAGLQSVRTATTVRSRNGSLSATDGPFAETKEHLGGFTLISARDLNEAMQLAAKLPATRLGSVEVRPILSLNTDLIDPLDRRIAAAIRKTGA